MNLSQINPVGLFFFSMQSSSRSIRQCPSRAHTVDLRPSYGRKTGQLKDTLLPIVHLIHVADMDETYGTSVDDEYVNNHDYDDDTDDDT